MNKIKDFIENEKKKNYFIEMQEKLAIERSNKTIYPPKELELASFDKMVDDLKVIIIGQDPYHNPDQANGLAFSVNRELKKLPPSLKNIYNELKTDIDDFIIPEHGDLSHWVKQGVLLLNTALTVEKNKPASHAKIGWTTFTNNVISYLNKEHIDLVFILWGNHAQAIGADIDETKHFVIKSSHPSPFSVKKSFYGSKPFSRTNEYLHSKNKKTIDWTIL